MWDTSDDVVYRQGRISRIVGSVVALSASVFGILILGATVWGAVTEGSEVIWGLMSTALFAAVAFVTWRMVLVRLSVGEPGVTIVNVLSTPQLPWKSIAGFEARGVGIVAILHDGRRVRIEAVWKSDVARIARRSTDADYVVRELNRTLDSVQRQRNLPRADPTAS